MPTAKIPPSPPPTISFTLLSALWWQCWHIMAHTDNFGNAPPLQIFSPKSTNDPFIYLCNNHLSLGQDWTCVEGHHSVHYRDLAWVILRDGKCPWALGRHSTGDTWHQRVLQSAGDLEENQPWVIPLIAYWRRPCFLFQHIPRLFCPCDER